MQHAGGDEPDPIEPHLRKEQQEEEPAQVPLGVADRRVPHPRGQGRHDGAAQRDAGEDHRGQHEQDRVGEGARGALCLGGIVPDEGGAEGGHEHGGERPAREEVEQQVGHEVGAGIGVAEVGEPEDPGGDEGPDQPHAAARRGEPGDDRRPALGRRSLQIRARSAVSPHGGFHAGPCR